VSRDGDKRFSDCDGCHGQKAVRGVSREATAALYMRRKHLCQGCASADMCYVAHQKPCARRRILSDPKMFCPAAPPRW